MYIPKHFDATQTKKINEFLSQNTFGQLISQVDGQVVATHLPFLFDPEQGKLALHIARANPQWKQLENQQILIIVNGPHGYISPSWYVDPGVPTWNYQAVHIYGKAVTYSDPEFLRATVNTLTSIEESAYPEPWETAYSDSMLRGIVGVEIEIQDIQCKFKLSQNRSKIEIESVTEQLDSQGNSDLAKAMRRENKSN